jgi:hypothetical protein
MSGKRYARNDKMRLDRFIMELANITRSTNWRTMTLCSLNLTIFMLISINILSSNRGGF